MPELPEVETVVRHLHPRLAGRRVRRIERARPGVWIPSPPDAADRWRGRLIRGVERRGKWILVRGTENWRLAIHLRMTGHLEIVDTGAALRPHTHCVLELDRGQELRFSDPRRFGRVLALGPGAASPLDRLGPEPFALDPATLHQGLAGRRAPLKAVLLDQSFVAGLGNIYVDEILFAAGVDPAMPARHLLRQEAQALVECMRALLSAAIAAGGSSVRDYRAPDGRAGRFQRRHRVYGRAGRPCPECGSRIRRRLLAGRGTHWCPWCQPRRRRNGGLADRQRIPSEVRRS